MIKKMGDTEAKLNEMLKLLPEVEEALRRWKRMLQQQDLPAELPNDLLKKLKEWAE